MFSPTKRPSSRLASFESFDTQRPSSPSDLLRRAASFDERPPSTSGLLRRASFFTPSVLLRRASFFTPSVLLHAERPSLPSFLLRRATSFDERPSSPSILLHAERPSSPSFLLHTQRPSSRRSSFFAELPSSHPASFFTPSVLLRRASFFTPSVLLHAECPSSPSILLHTQRPSSRRSSFFAELPSSPSVLLHAVPDLPCALRFAEHHSHYAISSCRASYCTPSRIHQASFLLPGIVHPARRVSISTVRGMPTVTVKGCRFLPECDTTVFSFVYTCIFNSLAWPIYLCYADRWLYIGSRYSEGSLECHSAAVGVRTNVISNKRAMLRFLITHNGSILYHVLVIPGGHPAWNRAKTLIGDKLL